MSAYLSTWGRNRLAIGICGRCSLKFALDDLEPDVNYPGLLVCRLDSDDYDPYRLPPRETEDITLDMPRPDTRLPLPGYVTVAPGDSNWPTTTFLGGNGAVQKPPAGNVS